MAFCIVTIETLYLYPLPIMNSYYICSKCKKYCQYIGHFSQMILGVAVVPSSDLYSRAQEKGSSSLKKLKCFFLYIPYFIMHIPYFIMHFYFVSKKFSQKIVAKCLYSKNCVHTNVCRAISRITKNDSPRHFQI